LLATLFADGVAAPVVGYQMMDVSGCVVAESELAWTEKKVAVLLAGAEGAVFESQGWKIVVVGDAELDTTLREHLKE
jgi:hypothetical protein